MRSRRERIEWYDSAMLSAATDELRQVGSNIHTDEEFAKSEGFPTINADGMIMTNWCSSMLLRELRPPLSRARRAAHQVHRAGDWSGVELHVRGRVREATTNPNGSTQYTIDVWCEDENGNKLVDGDAKVEVAPQLCCTRPAGTRDIPFATSDRSSTRARSPSSARPISPATSAAPRWRDSSNSGIRARSRRSTGRVRRSAACRAAQASRLAEVPELAILAVPANALIAAVRECAERGVRYGIAYAGGLAEAGRKGRRAAARARRAMPREKASSSAGRIASA